MLIYNTATGEGRMDFEGRLLEVARSLIDTDNMILNQVEVLKNMIVCLEEDNKELRNRLNEYIAMDTTQLVQDVFNSFKNDIEIKIESEK